MAREFSRAFYHSKVWKNTRESYFRFRDGLCEPCLKRGELKPGEIVHHKIPLTPENINDPSITLDFANLELVCRDCHALEHSDIYEARREPLRIAFDENGNVVRRINVED